MNIILQLRDPKSNRIITSVVCTYQSERDSIETFQRMLTGALVKGSLIVENNEMEDLKLNGTKIQTSANKNAVRTAHYHNTGN